LPGRHEWIKGAASKHRHQQGASFGLALWINLTKSAIWGLKPDEGPNPRGSFSTGALNTDRQQGQWCVKPLSAGLGINNRKDDSVARFRRRS
jgi:hypothetical protein